MTAVVGASSVPRPRHVQGLDGMRAVAAVLVVAYHVYFIAPRARGPVAGVSTLGWLGVDLFFAISGFILFLPYARAHLDGRRVDVRKFYRRRARRILPAFWLNLFVLVTLLNIGLLTTAHGWAVIVSNATFTAGYLGLASVNGIYWSLYCELGFYVTLPLLAKAFTRWGAPWGLALTMVLGATFRLLVVTLGSDGNHFAAVMQFPGVIDQFGFGMAAATFWARRETRTVPLSAFGAATLVSAGVALVGAVGFLIQRVIGLQSFWSGQGLGSPWALVLLRPLESAGFALVIVGVCLRPSILRAALEWRPVRYLGVVSYGIYLWHPVLVRELADEIARPGASSAFYLAMVVVVLALSTLWAEISYRFVERPFLTRGRSGQSTGGVAEREASRESSATPPGIATTPALDAQALGTGPAG